MPTRPWPPPSVGAAVDAPPVVDDLEAERAGLVAHERPSPCAGPGVLHHVGQRLLHDAVRGEVDAARQLDAVAVVRHVDRHARAVELARPAGRGRRARARARTRATRRRRRRSRAARRACGGSRPASSGSRREIASSARFASAGFVVDDVLADTDACTAITPIECATTSCSSRAMCRRSSATARRASSSFSRSSASARSSSASMRCLAVLEVDPEHEHRRERARSCSAKPLGVEHRCRRRAPARAGRRRSRPPRPTTFAAVAGRGDGDHGDPEEERRRALVVPEQAVERPPRSCRRAAPRAAARRRKTNGTAAASTRNDAERVLAARRRRLRHRAAPRGGRQTDDHEEDGDGAVDHPRVQAVEPVPERGAAASPVVTTSRYRSVASERIGLRGRPPRTSRDVRGPPPAPGEIRRSARRVAPRGRRFRAPFPHRCEGAHTPGPEAPVRHRTQEQERHMTATIETTRAPGPTRAAVPAPSTARRPGRRRREGLRQGRGRGPGPRRRHRRLRGRPLHRHHGPVGLGQVDADAQPRRARHAHRRARCAIGDTDLAHAQRPQAHAAAPRPRRLRLPGVQPRPDAHRGREHHAADARSPAASPTGRGSTTSSRPSVSADRLDAPPVGALRWSAAARRRGPGAGQPARDRLRRRAHRQPRLPHRRRDPRRSCARPCASSARPS